ncbi:hypothetical protein OE88DRAFT_1606346, partial [Heliocybe sulcata]
GHEGSDEHHDKEWVSEKVKKSIDRVGADRFVAVCSDNTGNTKAARRLLTNEVDTIQDLQDCCHHIHNTIKNISDLSEFKPMLSMVKAIIKHFSKSTYSTTMLRRERHVGENGEDEPVHALQRIGKTRFSTYWIAAHALDQCLPNIRALTRSNVISFRSKKVQDLFTNRTSTTYQIFELGLIQYIHTVAPFIRSLWVLESSEANASDVYVFWLATGATLTNLFSKPEDVSGIPRRLAENIIEIYNRRFKEFF